MLFEVCQHSMWRIYLRMFLLNVIVIGDHVLVVSVNVVVTGYGMGMY